MIITLMLLFSGAALLASAVYATSRLKRQASAAFVLARSLKRHTKRRKMSTGSAEAPDGWPYVL